MATTETYLDHLNRQFEAADKDGDWLGDFRQQGMQQFRQSGFPTQKVEAWKYTSLNKLRAANYDAPEAGDISRDQVPAPLVAGMAQIVLLDGVFRPDLSDLPAGVEALDTLTALGEGEERVRDGVSLAGSQSLPFTSLNSAFTSGGISLFVTADCRLELLCLSTSANRASHARNIIKLADGQQFDLVERHLALGVEDYFTNPVSHISVGEGARLRHIKVQNDALGAQHIATGFADVGARGLYENFTLSLGAGLARNEYHAALNGAEARVVLDGAYLMGGRQHCDTTTAIHHNSPDTSSQEIYKGVLDGRAKAVFAGRICVPKDSQRIEGRQLSRALLLSEGSEIYAKPELEIFADDVKCSHGATAGELAEDALFYLRARGIPESQARHMLVEAFVAEVIDSIGQEDARDGMKELVADWLQSHGTGD